MNREINIARNITNLRKKHKVTQEQLADAINVSPQAVSKWETAACQPDTLTLPLIASYFRVSIDYLFYGCEEANDEIYEEITNRVVSKPSGTGERYEEALRLASAAQHGILEGMEKDSQWCKRNGIIFKIREIPIHLMDGHGFSICSPKGFSAIVTDAFLNSLNGKTMKRAQRIFEVLANEDCLRVTVEILNFNGISLPELMEKTKLDEERIKAAIEMGKKAGFIEVRKSRHALLGSEYFIQRHHYNCLCFILSSIRMIEISLQGATRSVVNPGFSMSFDGFDEEATSDEKPSDGDK